MEEILFDYQKEGVEFLKKKKKAILADQMGLGKTRQTIVAAGEDSNGSIVIVCPASIKENWEREIHMVYPEDIVSILGGKDEGPEKAKPCTSWFIINYDNLTTHLEELLKKRFETLILDEIHYIKNHRTKRAKASLALAEKAKKVYGTTGTLMMNRPIELYSLLQAISHPLVSVEKDKSDWWKYLNFAIKFCGAYQRTNKYTGKQYWDVSGSRNLNELREQLKGYFLRRKKSDVLNLPEKIISNIPIKLDKEWRNKYDMAWENYMLFFYQSLPKAESQEDIKEIEKKIDNRLVAKHIIEIQKIKQVCSLAKVEMIVEAVNNIIDQGEQVVVFTQFTDTYNLFMEKFGRKAVGIDGSVKNNERQAKVDKFQNGKAKIFVGNIKAAGTGLNLFAASNVIFADLEWTPAIHEQAEDRLHRHGQKNLVNVYYFVARDTIEERVLDLLNRKAQIISEVIEGTSDNVRDFSVAGAFIKGNLER